MRVGLARLAAALLALVALPLQAEETPPGALPFVAASPGAGERLVLAHYFPPFPIQIGERGASGDYYERHYLRPEGENGKFARGGGYLRQRPLLPPGGLADAAAGFRLDVARAARVGIDGVGVDLLDLDGRHWRTTLALLDAARDAAPAFRIGPQPDMSALKDVTPARLAEALLVFARHPAALRLPDGRLLVMPFAAERVSGTFWQELASRMRSAGAPIALVPNFVNARTMDAYAGQSWAAALWGDRGSGAGPTQTRFAEQARAAGYPRWLATLAPQDFRPKDLMAWEVDGSTGLASAFTAAMTGKAAGLHLVTWNDYSEASELAPSSATRFAWYDLTAWYIAHFKRGRPPAIVRDGLIVLHRRQLFNPVDIARGAAWQLRGRDAVSNRIDVRLFLTAPASVSVTTGGIKSVRSVPAGFQRWQVPARPGAVRVQLTRAGKVLADCTSPHVIAAHPDRHDPLYAGFSSLRGCN